MSTLVDEKLIRDRRIHGRPRTCFGARKGPRLILSVRRASREESRSLDESAAWTTQQKRPPRFYPPDGSGGAGASGPMSGVGGSGSAMPSEPL